MSDETTTETDPQAEKKVKLAEELFETHMEIQRLEKKKAYLKDQLDPLLAEGERVGSVEKTVKRNLNVGAKLLDELEAKYGPSLVKRSVNTPALRKIMAEDKALDDSIPRKKSVILRVGEKWNG